MRSAEGKHLLAIDSPRHTFFEAVIGGSSSLIGRTLVESEFRARFSVRRSWRSIAPAPG